MYEIRSNSTTKSFKLISIFHFEFFKNYYVPKIIAYFFYYLNITFYLLQSLQRILFNEKPRMSNELTRYDSK